MDPIVNSISNKLLNSNSVGPSLRMVYDILTQWLAKANIDDLRVFLTKTSNPELYPGACYLPTSDELRQWSDGRVRDQILEQFPYDVLLDYPEFGII